MNLKTISKFYIFIFFSFFIIACKNGNDEDFFIENTYAAEIVGVEFSGSHRMSNTGFENISAGSDYVIFLNVSNPAGYNLDVTPEFATQIVSENVLFDFDSSSNKISITYPNSYLTDIEGTAYNDISAKIILKNCSKNLDSIEAIEDIYELKLKCNPPPPTVTNALSEIISTEEDKLLIAVDFPTTAINASVLKVTAQGITHTFPITNGTPSNDALGWTISSSKKTTESAYKKGIFFLSDPCSTPYYIETNLTGIKPKKPFPISLSFIDTEGVESDVYTYISHQELATTLNGNLITGNISAVTFSIPNENFRTNNIVNTIKTTIKAYNETGEDITSYITDWEIKIFDGATEITTGSYSDATITITSNEIEIICPEMQIDLRVFVKGTYNNFNYANTINMHLF